MIFTRLLKPRFISILIATFTALHMTAAVASKTNPGNKKETDPTISYAAIINGTDSASITEDDDPDFDNLLEVKGKLRVSDRNSGEAEFLAENINGSYGTFVIATKGHWYYAAENSQSIIQELANSDTLSDRLIVSSVDGTTHAVVITINGVDELSITDTNYAAVISGVDSGSVTEDNDPDGDDLLEISAKLNITDSDAGEDAFIATTHSGNYGSLTIDTAGYWNYAAANSQSVIQNLASGNTLTENLTVSSIDGTKHAVVITIIGVDELNQAAVISGTDSGSVTEDDDPDADNLLEVGGKLNITDSDTAEAAFIAVTSYGNYGSLYIDAAGSWNYAANNDQNVIQNLTDSDTLKDTLTVSSIDGTTHAVVITIIGADEPNQAAIISGTDTGSVTEDVDPDADNLLEVGGKLNITDNDAGEAAFIATTHNGNYGSLNIDAAGDWNYAANNDQNVIQNLTDSDTLKDTLTVSSIDGTTHAVVITIIGANEPNQAAIISGTDTGSVTADVDPNADNLLEAGGKLNITDNDPGEAAFTAETVNGNYGGLTIDADGNWNYAANNSQAIIQNLTSNDTLTDNLTVSSVDGTTHTVVIAIIGADETTNTLADINLSWVAPAEREDNEPISLSEIAGYKVYYGTTQGNYSSSVVINDGSATGHTFKDFPAGTYYFTVTTSDTEGRESQYSPEIKIVM